MKLLQVRGEPEVFIVLNDIKHWLQNKFTYDEYGKIYGFGWGEWGLVNLEEINEYETGKTLNTDSSVPTLPTRDIYNPMPEPGRKIYRCRAYLNHSQIIQKRVRTKIELDKVSYDPDGMFDLASHSIEIKGGEFASFIGEVWYDFGATDGGVYSVIVAKNDKHASKDCLIERDDMCAGKDSKDIQPHGTDWWPVKKKDRISLWTVPYFGGPCELKTAHTQNFLTVVVF